MLVLLDFAGKLLLGIVLAWAASLWAIRKFHAEKRWERKEKAYIEIINAMYDIKVYSSVQKTDYGQGTGYSDEKMDNFFDAYAESFSVLNKAMGVGFLYISKDALDILDRFSKRELPDQIENPKWEYYEVQFKICSKALEDLIAIAKKELALQ